MGASASGNSYLTTFKRCRRKFYWSNVRGLKPKGRAPALDIGTLVHEGLALLPYHGLDEAVDHMMNVYEGIPDHPEYSEGMAHAYDDDKVIDMAVVLLKGYKEAYATDPFTPLVEEHEFSLSLVNRAYTGKIDKIVRGPGDKLYVMEHKTTGLNPSAYLRTFYLDPQISGYYLGAVKALHSLNNGEGLAGVVVDLLTKPRMNKGGWGKHEYVRDVFTRSPAQLNDFILSTARVFDAIDQCAEEAAVIEDPKEAYYRCEHECFSFNRACAYLDLCRYGESPEIIEAEFTVEDPAKK